MDKIVFILPAFCACIALTLFLGYLGMHVLAREVIFVDIALAQIAALGVVVGQLRGVDPEVTPVLSLVWSLGFTFVGAALFALTRGLRKRIPQEAFIGITYAVSAAMAVLVANFVAAGDEKIKESLVGTLVSIQFPDVIRIVVILVVLGVVHVIFRKRFLELSFDHDNPKNDGWNAMLWDLLFYMTFGVVIASGVRIAGVLLVFSFLIVPAVFSALFARSLMVRLIIAWSLGIVVSAVGLYVGFDLPTGAAIVVTFGIALAIGVVVRALLASKFAAREASAGGSGTKAA